MKDLAVLLEEGLVTESILDALDKPWALGRGGFKALVGELASVSPITRLLEFGSGASTVALGMQYPSLSIVTVDHDSRYVPSIPPAIRGRVQQVISPLRTRVLAGVICRTYAYEPEGEFDAVLVDGPPGGTLNGRLGAMLLGYAALRVGGILVLDDAHRPGELRWVADFIGLTGARVHFVGAGHGLAVFHRHDIVRGTRAVIQANARTAVEQSMQTVLGTARRYFKRG